MGLPWAFLILVFCFSESLEAARTVYNFEAASQLTAFTVPATSTLTRSTTRFKDRSYSLKWTWASGDTITHSITPSITGNELTRGGIKLWIYNTHKRTDNLAVSFEGDVSGSTTTISQFQISLNFQNGWRAVWVSYSEAHSRSLTAIDRMKITAPTTTSPTQPLYFDLIRLVDSVRSQSRDKIVPTIGSGLYTPNNFWQQTYRWSQETPTPITVTSPDPEKLSDLILIEKRIDNWFLNQSQSSVDFDGNLKKRWDSLQTDINAAVTAFNTLNIVKSSSGVITGKPLYARNSEYKDKDFGFVMKDVLLPLALEYQIRSRSIEVDAVATKELPSLNNVATRAAAVARIAGTDSAMQTALTTALGMTTPYTVAKVKEAIKTLNNKRKDRLILLLEYIQDQGFADGSGLGSLGHEMNRDGAGFMNSVYVLRKVLEDAGKIPNIIATMKWYNEFGEVYQDPFEYAGTTADRMRTISVYRLFTVLMMQTSTTQEKKEKIRDMEALLRWYANALSFNEGFAGLLKPDFLGYHHNSYYASAYVPHALHAAALIEYFLSGTSFALGEDVVENIHKALEVMRVVPVKYSTPNSVGGRFPGFTRAVLAKTLPAYAYHAVTAPALTEEGSLGVLSCIKANNVPMFRRLYDTSETSVTEYLADGTIFTGIYYFNSIGSISILEDVNKKAELMNIRAESAPKGFWAKNYAAFVVYRRHDWAVSVKGFNKFVWDYEASNNQNLYGLYQSHGALLVANSEASLDAFDIDNGWDWTRHPGTTTIRMDLKQLISENRRYFQPKELAGGVMLIGGGDYPSGVFGMDFAQPFYRYPAGSFQLNINFNFKKSVFFSDHAIICLGSGITTTNSNPNITQTTLFQNKLVNPTSSIRINSTSHSLSTDLTKQPTNFDPASDSVTLMDTNGNGYFIPNAGTQGLNVKVGLQTSKAQNKKVGDTSARYATAWLNHGVNPTGKGYEYAILVGQSLSNTQWQVGRKRPVVIIGLIHPSFSFTLHQNLATRQASTDNKVYEVLHKDVKAHAVKINDSPKTGQTQYGYVMFDKSVRTPGAVRRVTKPCIVMVEEVDSNNVYISVSSPNLNLNTTRDLQVGSEVNADERFYSFSQPVEIEVFIRNAVNLNPEEIKQNGRIIPNTEKAAHLYIKPISVGATTGRRIKFKKLEKGFSTEVKLTR